MGAAAVVSRTINRGRSTHETASVRPAFEPFDDPRDRTVGLFVGLLSSGRDAAHHRSQLSTVNWQH